MSNLPIPYRAKFALAWEWLEHALTMKELALVVFGATGLGGIALAMWGRWLALPTLPKLLIGTGFAGIAMLMLSGLYGFVARLFLPPVLDVHLGQFTATLEDEDESRGLIRDSTGGINSPRAVVILGLQVTNQSPQAMSLDCLLRIALKSPSMLSRMFIDIGPAYVESHARRAFHEGWLAIPSRETVEVNKAFKFWETDIMAIRGLENVRKDGHRLVLTDRVTGRSREVAFEFLLGLPGA